ncbi:MAG: Uma2 family endonuclease [Bacteroidota bacterium]
MSDVITSIDQLDLTKRYTYADYLTWQFDERVELIRGRVFRMSPAPSSAHQWVSGELHFQIKRYLRRRTCKTYAAPFDVRLPLPPDRQTPDKVDTVVQPDICVICDPTKIEAQGCNGAPDWIIEILSPGTAHKDLNEKFDLYQHAGVREYWIVRLDEQTVTPFLLDEAGVYQILRAKPFAAPESVPVGVLAGLEIELGEVWA